MAENSNNSGGGMPPWLNATMKFILKSPLHGMLSKTILVLTFTGQKSGKIYSTPVSYSRQDGEVVMDKVTAAVIVRHFTPLVLAEIKIALEHKIFSFTSRV